MAKKAVAQSEYDAARRRLETAVAAKQGAVAAKVADEADITKAQAQVAKSQGGSRQAQLDLDWTVVQPRSVDGSQRQWSNAATWWKTVPR